MQACRKKLSMPNRPVDTPRILIAALRGGSGKTVISIGIIAALSQRQKTVAPFKKGPDYIDAGWLSMAAGRFCYNLDHFLASSADVYRAFYSRLAAERPEIAVIEGNRGLYDGLDAEGTTSTASLAKLIRTPVVLCLDCTKSTRTMAAVLLGCLHFDPGVAVRGVILNRVAGSRHERILRTSIEQHCGVPVLGAIPKLDPEDFPERHMGLIPTPEHTLVNRAIETAALTVSRHVDLDKLLQTAADAGPLHPPPEVSKPAADRGGETARILRPVKIGIIRDSAFQFYYPDNLQALEEAGAELVFVSPVSDKALPEVDALYIGGGFPETHAAMLAENSGFRSSLKSAAEAGLPIYAECGGLMYLGESLVLEESYPMTGVLPIVFGFSQKPQGHGYTRVFVDRENPYYPVGTQLRGHEFHYSRVLEWKGTADDMVFAMQKGKGIVNRRDGICRKNVLATYTHVHALGIPQWARVLVQRAAAHASPG
ncbi:MAG TPA: cobyrinate a,c-diamide synthase [Desulfosalsimonadaceae bacterium]|nr:cobyrinate a,c-diamide synthase [Desulfosalsimonadaceae bacterium]